MNDLTTQIVKAANKYALTEARTEDEKDRLRAAVLSGVSLAANYLVRTDGTTTPQQIEHAILEAAELLGFKMAKL